LKFQERSKKLNYLVRGLKRGRLCSEYKAFFGKESRSMAKGTVKRIMRDRGFGFISAEDGREIFFHRSELQNVSFEELQEGDSLEFNVVKGDKGPQAIGVKKAGE
jgi:CspA family cold shock protein